MPIAISEEQLALQASIRDWAKRADTLALVVGLQGRSSDAESIARAGLPSEAAAANVAYLRQMLAQQNGWKQSEQSGAIAVRAEGS